MREQKVYVDELPKSCGCCEFYSQDKYCAYCLMLNEKLRYIDKDKDCPLKSLHDHDKELVAKVLDSVKNEAYKDGFYDEDGNKIITYHINNYILDQIQKDFEK